MVVFILALFVDIFCLVRLRDLVYSFLLSKMKPQFASKIHKEQDFKSKFTLSYIKNYTLFPSEFKFYQKCLIIYYCAVIPKNILLFTIIMLTDFYGIIVASLIFILRTVVGLFGIESSNFSNKISRFDRRYRQNLRKRK